MHWFRIAGSFAPSLRELRDGRPVPDGDVSSATFETAALVRREALRGGVRIRATGRLAWEPGLRLGVVAYRRTTEPGTGDMEPTGARTIVSPLFGPESRVGVRLVGATELALAVGFEVVPRVPEIGYEIAAELRPVLRPWQLQPRIALSLGAGKSAGR